MPNEQQRHDISDKVWALLKPFVTAIQIRCILLWANILSRSRVNTIQHRHNVHVFAVFMSFALADEPIYLVHLLYTCPMLFRLPALNYPAVTIASVLRCYCMPVPRMLSRQNLTPTRSFHKQRMRARQRSSLRRAAKTLDLTPTAMLGV